MKAILAAFVAAGLFTQPAHSKEVLTVYTYESFIAEWGPGPQVKALFEKQCECTITWVGVQDGVALLNRLKLEGSATKADIVLGLDNSIAAEARALGLFAPHGMDAGNHRVPGWKDDTFMPFDYGYFAVVYDTQTLKSPPASLEELISGPAEEKIVIQDPRTSTPGLGLLLWIKLVYGEKAGDAWMEFKDRILTVTPGWSEAYSLFTKGEAPMVLSYTTSPAYHMIAEKTDRYQAAKFSEGHYVQVEVAGMTATGAKREVAKQFLEFMMSPGFQDVIPTSNWMLPAGETAKPLPAEFGKLVKPEQALQFSPEEVAANRKAWTDEWLNATSR
ncbi:MAG: thiamine ABC transporter substrate binding subunit [Pseudomonadota bacterium]|nr:thiamine ABC transporter substrate binding subunit [Pseudomonadota bacterium]